MEDEKAIYEERDINFTYKIHLSLMAVCYILVGLAFIIAHCIKDDWKNYVGLSVLIGWLYYINS